MKTGLCYYLLGVFFGAVFSQYGVYGVCNPTTARPDTINCTTVLNQTNLCYAISDFCCETCLKFSTNIQGCEFGDKTPDCNTSYCNLADGTQNGTNQNLCCETCSSTTVTTTPVTVTTTPAADAKSCQNCESTTTVMATSGPHNVTLCLNPSGQYYSIPCTSVKWEPYMCDDPAFNFYCCQNCTVTTQVPPVTVTPPSPKMCLKREARYPTTLCGFIRRITRLPTREFCSVPYISSHCCKKCPKVCTDRWKICQLLTKMLPKSICQGDVCCKSCRKVQVKGPFVIRNLKRWKKGRWKTYKRQIIDN